MVLIPNTRKGKIFRTGTLNSSSRPLNLTLAAPLILWVLWLFPGQKATYKGTGTINGSGNYAFLVTVIDGNLTGGGGYDRFRIKIWDGNNVIYDNNIGSAGVDDNDLPVTALGGRFHRYP